MQIYLGHTKQQCYFPSCISGTRPSSKYIGSGFCFVSFYFKPSGDPGETPVSHGAHLGGAITGVLLGLAILQNLKKRFYEGILWKVALGTSNVNSLSFCNC